MYDLYSEYRSILRADLSCASIWERLERYGSEITFIRRDIEMAIEKQEATSVPVLRVGSKVVAASKTAFGKPDRALVALLPMMF